MTHVTRLPALVTLNQLSFQFADGDCLFDALDLRLDQRPTAIVGRNGSGKSVLARLISGQLQPSAGTLNCHASVAYVAQEPPCVDGQTVAQAAGVASTLDALARLAAGHARAQDLEDVAERWDLAERFASMLAQAGLAGHCAAVRGQCQTHVPSAYLDQHLTLLDPERSVVEQLNLLDTPLSEGAVRSRLAQLQLDARRVHVPTGQLSGGERLKAALAIASWGNTPAQLLLLDEPTNHLDLDSVQALEQALRGFGGALIAASHDAAFLQALQPTHHLHWSAHGWQLQEVGQTLPG